MSRDVIYIDVPAGVLRVETDRDDTGKVVSARVTIYDQQRDTILDERETAQLVQALCPRPP